MGSDAAGCTDFKANSQGQLRNILSPAGLTCLQNQAFAHGFAPGARLFDPSAAGVSDRVKESATTLWGFSTVFESAARDALRLRRISIALDKKGR